MEYGLISIFGAGVVTFLTPCVLPLVPIYLAVLAGGSIIDAPRSQLVYRALLFSVGFTFVFTMMGIGASSLGSLLRDHGGWVQGVGALIVLVFALKFLGIINIPFLDRIAKADDRRFQTRLAGLNALIMGVVFAAGWSPCVGPVLGSVLTYTATASSDPWVGAGYLSLYGTGFALPLLITAVFAQASLRFLSRINTHLPRIERVIGILMLAVSGYLAMNAYEQLSQPVNEESKSDTLAALLDTANNGDHPLPVMVEFYSSDCTVCKEMKPVLDTILDQCDRNGVRVKTVDVSAPENRHYTTELRLVGVPTFVFVDEYANEAARLVGRQTESTLKQGLSALRGESCPGMTMLSEPETSGNIPQKLAFPKPNRHEEPVACHSSKRRKQPASTTKKLTAVSEKQSTLDISAMLSEKEGCMESEFQGAPIPKS